MANASAIEKLKIAFTNIFNRPAEVIAQAPGRINIIGEHIDYNDGFVLPVSIDKYITAVSGTNDSADRFRLHALDVGESFEWTSTQINNDRPLWVNYIYGSICEWQKAGFARGGIDLIFSGDIPTGAGLSSSAALEAASALAIGKLWDISIEKRDLALHCQKVEHEYVGVKCGIMDQYASIFGHSNKAVLLDCLSVTHRYLPLEMENHLFLLCNTGVTHSLASSGYNDRRASCDAVIKLMKHGFVHLNTWRDVTLEMLDSFRTKMKEEDYKRATHVIREIARVEKSADALQKKDLHLLGKLMYESHHDLSTNYEVSCPELDFLVEQAKKQPGILGARMMGGGFGGCTINLIEKKQVNDFIQQATQAYEDQFNLDLECYIVQSGEGAKVIS